MKKYRIVNRNTGREVVTVNVPMLTHITNLANYVLNKVVDYCDTDGVFMIDWNSYAADDLIVTDSKLIFEEKVRLLKDCGLSEYDSRNYVINDNVNFYDNNITGFNDYKSNMKDFEHGEIESEWKHLTQIDVINDSGCVIGSYRVELLS